MFIANLNIYHPEGGTGKAILPFNPIPGDRESGEGGAMKMVMNSEIARAASWDAANRNMKKNGRVKWNRDDYNEAVQVYDRLWPVSAEMDNLIERGKP